jgi:hypothetical protein
MEQHIQPVKHLRYFALSASGEESARLDPGFAEQLKRCDTCLTYAIPRHGQVIKLCYLPRHLTITFVWDTNVTLLSVRFLEALRQNLGKEGANFFATDEIAIRGASVTDYYGFRCRYQTNVRGTENVRHFVCPNCGNTAYVAFGWQYLVAPIDRAVPIFGGGAGRIVLREDLMQTLPTSDPGLEIEELRVEAEPHDGLPGHLPISEV